MSQTVPLSVSAQVKLSATGGGTVALGPSLPGVTWNPSSCAVLVQPTSTTVVSQFLLYNGVAQPGNFIGGTYSGDNNSTGLSAPGLHCGQILTGVWTGGNPSATATMTLTGTQDIPG